MADPEKDATEPDNIIKFPTESLAKLGFKRVKTPKRSKQELRGQLFLFGERDDSSAEVVPLESGMSPFEQALFYDERDDVRATKLYEKAIAEEDSVADSYTNLGVIRSKAGDRRAAFNCFTLALEDDPRHFESHFNLGNLYFESGDYNLARLHYQIAADLIPDFPSVYFNLGLAEAMLENYRAAVDCLHRFKELVGSEEGAQADDLIESIELSMAQES